MYRLRLPDTLDIPENTILQNESQHILARTAAQIVAGLELVDGRWVQAVLMTGPGIEERLYHYDWRNKSYKYRVRCQGLNGQPCQNTNGGWMHPTNKGSQYCITCWEAAKTPGSGMNQTAREKLAERNRKMNRLLPPRLREV